MLALFSIAAGFIAVAHADHRITLRNNCNFGVGMTLSNFPHNGMDYTGPAIPDLLAKMSHDIFVPTRWNGRICDHPPNSGTNFLGFGCSLWFFDSSLIGGNTDYDISNIQGFSVAQQIIPDSGEVLTCTNVNCPCNEAYRPGDTTGTCGETGPIDQATRVAPSLGFTVA
ncbi:hypothetical protein B0H14DRAFT_3457467 [Mycena olivaceomarginata]|nr:hypothetical protein B0H14DRAFT_3457467 [Mycena olivaceomarginata]